MKYGKLIDGVVYYIQIPFEHENQIIFTGDPSVILRYGYKQVITSPRPRDKDHTYVPSWTENDTQITQIWTPKPLTEAQLEKRYKQRTVFYIRERYTATQEFAILREYLSLGADYKAPFDEYNQYVEECKTRAHAEVYGDSAQ